VEEYGRGLRDEAGNGEEDFALCKTISVLSIPEVLSAKITRRSIRLPQYTNIRRSRRLQTLPTLARGTQVAGLYRVLYRWDKCPVPDDRPTPYLFTA